MPRSTRSVVATATATVVVAAAAAGALATAVRAAPAVVRPATAESVWLVRVSAICHRYQRELQKVPAPATVSSTLVLGSLAARALPLLEGQAREVRRVAPPASLQAQVAALLHDDDGAILALRSLRVAAKREDLRAAQQALVVFLAAQSAARQRSLALGITC